MAREAPWKEAGDASLVEHIDQGSQEALAEAHRRWAGTVHGVARRLLGDADLADDIVQEVFLRLWHEPQKFDPERGALSAYLSAQAHARAIDLLRSLSARRRREERYSRVEPASGDIETEVWRRHQAEHVRAALTTLNCSERAPISLAYFGGRSYREVAAGLQQPEGTVKSRIRKGLRHMQQPLSRAGMGPSGPP